MWSTLQLFLPGRAALRRVTVAGSLVGLVALAFFCGHLGWLVPQAKANPPSADPFITPLPVVPASGSDYSRRVVAYIYGTIPITREELGEYLIARMGAERVEYMVDERILQRACQARGVQITDAEVEARLKEDVKTMKISVAEFENKVLKRLNKTLYEYREDHIRPQLALAKLCRDRVIVTAEDLQKAFEARYGEMVRCRMIVFNENSHNRAMEVYAKVRDNDAEFMNEAKNQFIPQLASKGGEVSPIYRHFPDKKIEEQAFSLKPGQVSILIQLADWTEMILKCIEHIPARTDVTLDQVRATLQKEIFDAKLAQQIPLLFQELRKEAHPDIFLKKQITQADLERRMGPLMGLSGANTPPMARATPAPSTPTPPPVVNAPGIQVMPELPTRGAAPRGN